MILYTITPFVSNFIRLFARTTPAGSAVLPLLMEPEYYTDGKAAGFSVSRVSQLLGFNLSGALIAWIGTAGAL